MRVVIVGASGNVGTALLRRLHSERGVAPVGVVRRPPGPDAGPPYTGVEWHAYDIGAPGASLRLAEVFSGADAVVHLAWQIQPSHDQDVLHRTNVGGSQAVFDAVARADVPALVYASSVGAYAPGPKDLFVDESWPTTGVPESSYSREKAEVERILDRFEADHPDTRVVRLRPGLIFQRDVGAEIARYFLGPFAPVQLLRFGRLPIVPRNDRLRMQAVHADDVADAYARALLRDVRGAFNIAADPVLTPELVASRFHGRTIPVPAKALVVAADLTWRARLQPVDRGWVELALKAPLMSTGRALHVLGWRPARDALEALRDLLAGLSVRARTPSPPLSGAPDLAGRLGGVVRGRLPGHGNPY